MKTYRPFEADFSEAADRGRFRDVGETEFRKEAGEATRKSFRVRPKYSPGTRFHRATFPTDADGRAMLLVRHTSGMVYFADVLPGPATKSQSAAASTEGLTSVREGP